MCDGIADELLGLTWGHTFEQTEQASHRSVGGHPEASINASCEG